MKNLLLLIALMTGIYSVSAQGVEEYFQCVSCRSNAVNFGSYSSAIGTNNTSTGTRSFAGGFNSQATGDYSFAFGEGALSTGINSFALGKEAKAGIVNSVAIGFQSEATQPFAFAIGYRNHAHAMTSFLFGENLKTVHSGAMIIGRGTSGFLINDKNNSLMIGFNSNLPTLFVGQSSGDGATGKIGIGNITESDYKLHILSDVGEAAELKLEYRTTGNKQFAKIHFGDYSIRGGIDGGIQGFVFTTPSSTRHFVFQNGTIRNVSGSASAPAYSFSESSGTGMFRPPSANTIAFSTGGYEWVRINSSGNVGIGTTDPGAYKLAVAGSGSFSGVLSVTGTENSSIAGNLGIGVTAPSEKLDVTGWAKTSSGYKVGTSIVINSDRDYSGGSGTFSGVLSVSGSGNSSIIGNVGIGTTTPDKKLTVAGDISFTGDLYKNGVLFNSSNWTVAGENIYRANGNVGIGTASPDKKLVVAGDISFTGDLYKNGVLFNSSNWTVAGENIYRANGNVGIGTTTPSEKLDVAGYVRSTEGFKVGDNYVIDVNRNFNGNNSTFSGILSVTGNSHFTGNVGIGTTSPDAKFHVKANESSTFTAKIQTGNKSVYFGRAIYGSGLEWGNSYIGLGLFRDGDNSWKTEVDAAANGGAMIWGTIGGSLAFTCIPTSTQPGQQVLNDAEIKANTRMYLTSTGVLKVNEVLVKTDIWSDYVFHDEYKLPDLYEVEKFISENRHLPDIPSERVVMEEGINLGEMDALLLKKIEELTLYVIELKKENEVMRHQIEQLAK